MTDDASKPQAALALVEPPTDAPTLVEPPKRVIGKPWPKGVSGNPGGKSKALEAVRTAARKHGLEAVEALVDAMRSGPPKIRVMAAMALLDRGFGKPEQHIDADGSALLGLIYLPTPESQR